MYPQNKKHRMVQKAPKILRRPTRIHLLPKLPTQKTTTSPPSDFSMITENKKTVEAPPIETAWLGTKVGPCDICKVTKKLFLLRYGFSLCEDCLHICTLILEQLQLNEEKLSPTKKQKSTRRAKICYVPQKK